MQDVLFIEIFVQNQLKLHFEVIENKVDFYKIIVLV